MAGDDLNAPNHVRTDPQGTYEPPEPETTSTLTTSPEQTWAELTAYVSKWFYHPDTEALAATLAVCASHTMTKRDPLWSFLVGPSSSFKTSVLIQACSSAPNAHIISKLTPKAFVSHHNKGVTPAKGRKAAPSGLLDRVGPSGILLFKDFTTILSMREDDRSVIAGDLREIYDGRITLNSGVGGSDWAGKITVLAACTPALDRAWGLKRELGERFVTIRLNYVEDDLELSIRANEQRGVEEQIASSIAMLGRRMISYATGDAGPPPKSYTRRIGILASVAAKLRGTVSRNKQKRSVVEDTSCEQSPRISKSFGLLLTAHAAMFQRPPDERDFRIVRRVAFDTIPPTRLKVLLALAPGADLTRIELTKVTGIGYENMRWVCDDLKALEIITERSETETGTDERTYQLKPKYVEYLEEVGVWKT